MLDYMAARASTTSNVRRQGIHWINITREVVRFATIRKH